MKLDMKEWISKVTNALKADYIVEEGTSGIWTYRKWNSGIAECWGVTTSPSTAFSATGNVYYRNITGIALPTGLFNSAPIVVANVSMGNVGGSTVSGITASTFAVGVLSAVSTARSIDIYVHAKGTWK